MYGNSLKHLKSLKFFHEMWNQDYVNILTKIYVFDVVSMLKLKSKIVVSNNNVSITEILEITKLVTSRKQLCIPNSQTMQRSKDRNTSPKKKKMLGWKRRLSSYRLTIVVFFVLFEGTILFFTDFILKT